MTQQHIPIMVQPILDLLRAGADDVQYIVDGTVGAGGHSHALLQAGVSTLLGLDKDADALRLAAERLQPFGDRVMLRHDSYTSMAGAVAQLGWPRVDGILLDLGISSMQIDRPERGFAFRHDGPLDMRFDASSDGLTAAQIVNEWTADALADLLFKWGEERHARRIAQAVVAARPITRTTELAEVIAGAVPLPRKRGKPARSSVHPATRAFQALRIAVNDELAQVSAVLPIAIDLLRPGARLAVISFHSLEDRIVKQVFSEASITVKSPPGMMLPEKTASVHRVTRKPVIADESELALNPRSRSAKLRVVEKVKLYDAETN